MTLNLFAVLRIWAGLLLAAVVALPCMAQSDWGTPAQEETLALARVNLRRGQIGLAALAFNAQLQSAAGGHANYLIVNNLSGHFENAAQYPTGFTGNTPSDRIASAGYTYIPAANGAYSFSTGEVVSRGPLHGEDAVDGLITAIYHRMDIFGTSFNEHGAGVGQGTQGVTVINFGSRNYPGPSAPVGWVGVYPFDGQTGAGVDFYSAEESPRPPMPNQLNRVGYPVSLQIDGAKVLTVTGFTLAPVGGSPLPVQLLSNGNGDTNMPASAAAIVPLGVLAYGTTYEASFSGGNGRYAVSYSYTVAAALSLAAYVGSDGFSFHADAPATVTVTVTDGDGTIATMPVVVKSAAEKLLPLGAGWNLVGNSTTVALDVASRLGNALNVNTVWKWLPVKANWAFYTPSLADGGAAYAAGKGYDFLTTIAPGDGFWVNAKAAFNAPLPAGAAIFSTSLRLALGSGWSLVAIGDARTPRGFNNAVGAAAAPGDIPVNVTTLWAWDGVQSNWYFYAPVLDKSSGLTGYIQQKSYLDFGTKTLDPITGFWVNKP